ncbi:Clusterin-associated protein-1 [Dactylococcopsis salina PCC 8305]|uniref:Clusterin-associated protein-1 n=2 Tax=Dactylococcopsis salina TaxID=292566 RepID=K9YRD1_DACS8|nr:Clusterin-associated protein-1 [Dactylococcopsis salina PCC 8305]
MSSKNTAMTTAKPEVISINRKSSPQQLTTLETNNLKKEEIIDYLLQEIGGRKSYYQPLKKEGLKVILQLVLENPDGKEALTRLVKKQAEQADINRSLGGKVSGLNKRIDSRDRTIENLMQHLNALKQKINQASQAINKSLEELTYIEKSEIITGIKYIQTWLDKNFTYKS